MTITANNWEIGVRSVNKNYEDMKVFKCEHKNKNIIENKDGKISISAANDGTLDKWLTITQKMDQIQKGKIVPCI